MKSDSGKTVYIIFMPGYSYDDFYQYPMGEPKGFNYILREEIEKAGLKVKFATDANGLEDVAGIVSWDLNQNILNSLRLHPPRKCILLTFEPPVVAPVYYNPILKRYFGTIFTLIDDLVDNKTYFKIHVMTCNRIKRIEGIKDFSDKKLCCLINNNKLYRNLGELYTERRKAIEFFKQTEEFDLFGSGWEGNAAWKGMLENQAKMNALKNYKFIVCYENMTQQCGYVSEKIIEALIAGCVPIYFGATNIDEYVPKAAFIDFREYHSYADLYQFMKTMDRKTYEAYLDAGRKFLESPQIECFSKEYHAKRVLDRILSYAMVT